MSPQTRPTPPTAGRPTTRLTTAPGFDRLPRYGPQGSEAPHNARRPRSSPNRDPEGRGALFSGAAQEPPPGSITLTCSSCRRTSVLTPLQLIVLAIPSVHLWPLLRHHPSWMRCPACRRRTWVALAIRF